MYSVNCVNDIATDQPQTFQMRTPEDAGRKLEELKSEYKLVTITHETLGVIAVSGTDNDLINETLNVMPLNTDSSRDTLGLKRKSK